MTDHLDKMRNDRKDFDKGSLENVEHKEPLLFLSEWYRDSHENNCADPHAMILATVGKDGKPSSRVVYMRELVEEGVIFYTNYRSKKGNQIMENNNVSALFYWDCNERQVRIEGKALKVSDEMSDLYFSQRPRISQIGAWASDQSSEIQDRKTLEDRVKHFEKKFPDVVPRPPHWGGYLIIPEYFEFWQGRLGRLHDRIIFSLLKDGSWHVSRICP